MVPHPLTSADKSFFLVIALNSGRDLIVLSVQLEFEIFCLTFDVVSRDLTFAVWTFDIAHLRLMITFSWLPLLFTDEISSNKRNKFCETRTMDGCVSPPRALFDGNSNGRSKKWRCYFIDALTEDTFGLEAYDKDKSSTCYKSLNSLLRNIK